MPLDLTRLAIRNAVTHDRIIRALLRSRRGTRPVQEVRRARAATVAAALLGRAPSVSP